MNRRLLAVLSGCAVAAAVAGWLLHERTADMAEKIAELQQIVTTADDSLVGYTRYKDYIAGSRKSLSGQATFLAANVTRHYSVNRYVERSLLGVKSSGAVVVTYAVDYSFGYDLAPDSYDVVDAPSGLEIRIARPGLVAAPAVRDLHHEVLASGWLTDEKVAALKLYEGASKAAAADGERMKSDPEVVALCEQRLIAFLHDFLAKQPGVERVPAITVSYARPAAPEGRRAQ
jgi:hypothetical protein